MFENGFILAKFVKNVISGNEDSFLFFCESGLRAEITENMILPSFLSNNTN